MKQLPQPVDICAPLRRGSPRAVHGTALFCSSFCEKLAEQHCRKTERTIPRISQTAFVFSIDAMFSIITLLIVFAALSGLYMASSDYSAKEAGRAASDAAIVSMYLDKDATWLDGEEITPIVFLPSNKSMSFCRSILVYNGAAIETGNSFCASAGVI